MASDIAEAIFFIKSAGSRIIFPDPKPDNIESFASSDREAFIEQALADAFAQKLLLRIKPRKLDWPASRYSRLNVSSDQLCVARGDAIDLGKQKNIFRLGYFRSNLCRRKSLRNICLEVFWRVFGMAFKSIAKSRFRELGRQCDVRFRSYSNSNTVHRFCPAHAAGIDSSASPASPTASVIAMKLGSEMLQPEEASSASSNDELHATT